MSSFKCESIRFIFSRSNDRPFLQSVVKYSMKYENLYEFFCWKYDNYLLYISQLYIQNIVKSTIMLNVKIIFQENDFFKTFVPCVLYII